MDQSVLMNTDIDKSTESRYICHHTRQFHVNAQIADGIDAFGKAEKIELLARVPPGLLQLVHNIVKRQNADGFGFITVKMEFNFMADRALFQQV